MNQEEPDTTFAAQVEGTVLELPPPESSPTPADDTVPAQEMPAVDETPPNPDLTDTIRAAVDAAVVDGHELTAFIAGYRTCFEILYGGISEASDADIERLYRQKAEEAVRAAALQKETGDVQGWVAEQDKLDPAATGVRDVPAELWDTVAEPTAIADMREVMGGDIQIPANSETVLGDAPLEELDVEKTLREQALEIERLNQASLRDTAAVQNWAAASDWFNDLLAGTEWADGPEPLLTRVQRFIAVLRAKEQDVDDPMRTA